MSTIYTVFDVETPNRHNDRICSIGLSFVNDGAITRSVSYLVDPECEFDAVNTSIHGIRPDDVHGQPTFFSLWDELAPAFSQNIVVAHSAGFDLSVLRKTLEHYHLPFPEIRYLDTSPLIRSFYPGCPNCRLDTVCDYLHLHLEHHDAGSDALAAAEVLLDMLRRGPLEAKAQLYALGPSGHSGFSVRLSSASLRLRELRQLMTYIVADDEVSIREFWTLFCWMRDNLDLLGNYPFDDIYNMLIETLDDGIVEPCELDALLSQMRDLLDPVCSACSTDEICVSGLNVVLTGDFARGARSAIEADLIYRGATIQKSVTKKTNLLLVGSLGSEAWVHGNYGTKVKKAMELQASGLPIHIMKEEDFFEVKTWNK